jgi:hypothetical protein
LRCIGRICADSEAEQQEHPSLRKHGTCYYQASESTGTAMRPCAVVDAQLEAVVDESAPSRLRLRSR